MQKNTHKIFLLVGPSGVGKNAVIEKVLKRIPEIRRVPSFTTRKKRPVEKEGREHFFVSADRFRQLIKEDCLLEYQEVYPGLFYGMAKKETLEFLKKNDLVRDIDILGEQAIKKEFPENSVSIFLKPPSMEALRKRIMKRGKVEEKDVDERLKRAQMEIQKANLADYQVLNDKLPQCIDEVVMIIRKEMKR